MINACGGMVGEVAGKEDLKKVKKLLSQYPFLLNEDIDGAGFTPLMMASMCNSLSVINYLLSLKHIQLNKVKNKVNHSV
jgi:ankyrin repeat protein